MKNKKIGIARREIHDDGTLGRLYMTEGDLKSAVRSALRKAWTSSTKRVFLESVRFPYVGPKRYKWAVKCERCSGVMGLSQREYRKLSSGDFSKHKRVVYEVDHINGNPPFNTLADLSAWADNLFNGALRVLCVECHKIRTTKQRKEKS